MLNPGPVLRPQPWLRLHLATGATAVVQSKHASCVLRADQLFASVPLCLCAACSNRVPGAAQLDVFLRIHGPGALRTHQCIPQCISAVCGCRPSLAHKLGGKGCCFRSI